MECLLCLSNSELSFKDTYTCCECGLVFKDPNTFLNHDAEVARYSTHQNNENDSGYVNFLKRLVDPLTNFLPPSFNSIDFGCGPGPTVSKLLAELGGKTENYDPNFFPDGQLLIPEFYDVVTCTEVVEHFKRPLQDWDQLVELVKDGGILAVMTQLITEDINYEKWWYKNDPTHVVFYAPETINFLSKKYEMELIYSDNKSVLIFRKSEMI